MTTTCNQSLKVQNSNVLIPHTGMNNHPLACKNKGEEYLLSSAIN